MKKIFLLLTVFTSLIAQSQVGVNTTDPKTTLHIVPSNTDQTTAEGIIAPNLTRSSVIAKNTKYTLDQKGAMVFVTDLSGTLDTKTAKITKVGYYYFDGSLWQPFGNTDPIVIPTEPLQVQATSTKATLNTENVYQQGKLAIGTTSATPVSGYNLDVNGTSNVSGNSRVGSSTVLGNEQVNGNMGVGGTLNVTGATGLSNSLTVAGVSNLNGATNAKATTITGQLRYTIGTPATNKVLISSDANGNATWATAQSLITIPTEPLQVQATTTKATLNTENVYQQGKLAIGTTSATPVSAYTLDVNGTSNVSGNSRVGSSTVLGAETVGGTLGVTGTSTLTGNVGIGAAPSNASAQLELATNNKGFLPNRVALIALTNKAPLSVVADGMFVYNTTVDEAQKLMKGYYMWSDNTWQRVQIVLPNNTANVINFKQGADAVFSITTTTANVANGQVVPFEDLIINDDGSYAFSYRLYGTVQRSDNNIIPWYIGVFANNVLVDAAEIDITVIGGIVRAISYSVTLGGTFKKGDVITTKMSTSGTVWNLKGAYNGYGPVRSSMIWWKL